LCFFESSNITSDQTQIFLHLQALFPFSTVPCRTVFNATMNNVADSITLYYPVDIFKRHAASFCYEDFASSPNVTFTIVSSTP
jgi:hypothetical protein